ncbi:MAG: hypothetical protein FWD65_02235 [Coriobacteriia bacterium]|nr:hypothetical protein [Coriobacteriia bacterium]
MPNQQRHTFYQAKSIPTSRVARRTRHVVRSPARRRDDKQPVTINSRNIRLGQGTGDLLAGRPDDAAIGGDPLLIEASGQGQGYRQGYGQGSGQALERTLCDDMLLDVRSRQDRRRKRQRRRRQAVTILVALCLAAIFGAGLFWMRYSNNQANILTRLLASQQPAANSAAPTVAASASTETTGLPTPVVASFKGTPLHLSVRLRDLTEVGFHPASNAYAMVLDTTLTPADAGAVRAAGTTGRDKAQQPAGAVPLIGSYIQMWRTDTGSIPVRTSIDEGAPAGSVTYAPITGAITAVREYNYENGCKDYEVHMSFEATALARYEVVMIHEENVQVKVGERVVGGVTPIAQVRDLTPFLVNQLAQYTGEAGNHAHVQINDLQAPSYSERQKYREQHNYYID